MYTYTFGGKHGKKHTLYESTDRLVVRTRNARDLDKSVFSEEGLEVLNDFNVEMEFPDADVTVLKTRDSVTDHVTARDNARSALKNEPEVRFAGRVLVEADGLTPVIYTENIFIKFFDAIKIDTCEKILAENKLTIKQRLTYAMNTFFVSAPEDTGLEIFKIAEYLLNRKEVELCHPELIRKKGFRNIHSKQWHLKDTIVNGVHINAGVKADQAHRLSLGENIVIAVIDDGFDIDHNEFNQPAKVIHARDITLNSNDPRPKNIGDNHGTACAGVATAAGIKASGVAPKAVLMPIRLHAGLGSIAEANAFKWAVDHGADIISCSWGPMDGYWTDPDDPVHTSLVEVPDHTRLAIDYAVNQGREGKGCIITFAAGNGNEDIRYDGYASYHKVLAVAACNDTNKRSVYSDFGQSVWCTFPSNDVGYPPFNHPDPLTQGIYTTDRIGVAGYNRTDDYTSDFGGTSSACPGVAGIIALILSVNPGLNAQQVKEIIRETAEKIDASNGQYDLQGHSIYYGYGKANAEEAVKRALALRSPLPADMVRIVSALVNPKGSDKGAENITLLNTSSDIANISNWSLEVKGRKEMLTGVLSGGEARTIRLDGSSLKLPNTGATIYLLNPEQKVIHAVTYRKKQIQNGVVVEF